MTYAARISALDDLITTTTSCSPYDDARQFKHLKDSALKTIKAQQHVRVNQFDVHARLEGLVEKFFVLNNEPLADALKLRLDELAETSSTWKPEILALLLGLSDRPVENTDVDEALRVHVPEPEPQLTWAEIIADDPLTEEGVWDDIEVDSDYSDHHAASLSDVSVADQTTSTQASSVGEEDLAAFAGTFIVSPNTETLNHVKNLRGRLANLHREPELTELQSIRQVLSMLHGLPSDMFGGFESDQIRLRSSCRITGVAASTAEQTLRHLAAVGSKLSVARGFVNSTQSSAILQRLQAAIQTHLHTFGKALSCIEQKYLLPDSPAVVSLMSVQAEVDHISRPLARLAPILPRKTETTASPWLHTLNRLYEETCILHLTGEEDEFGSFARLFFDCLHVYLESVRMWMTEGKLEEDSSDSFFVKSNDNQNDLGSIWQSRFFISRNEDGTVCAPSFMQHIAIRVFKAGKSVKFLEALGQGPNSMNVSSSTHAFDSNSLLDLMVDTLQPFSEVLKINLVQWLDAQEGSGSQTLLHTLNSRCGLYATVKALNHLYFGRHGAQSQTLAYGLFARIDRGSGWADRFLLTELAQNAFDTIPDVDASHISVRIKPLADKGSTLSAERKSDLLDRIVIDYSIPWPIQNVLNTGSLMVCQQAFSTLIRLQRAHYLLNQQEWSLTIMADQLKRDQVKQLLSLRQRLTWFTSLLRSYFSDMASLAIHQLITDLDRAADVDDLVTAFASFQHNVASKLLLQKNLEPIRRAMLAILDLCEDLTVAWRDTIKHISDEVSKPTSRHVVVQKSRSVRVDTHDDSDSSEDEDGDDDQQTPGESAPSVPNALKEYDRQLAFALAGLRGVSRVGGEPAWMTLSEKLQLGSGVNKRR